MGKIYIEGIGTVEIEGDIPTDEEQTAILGALGNIGNEERRQEQDLFPAENPPEEQTRVAPTGGDYLQGTGLRLQPIKPREGPLGIMPAETRGQVRSSIEKQPGLVQLAAEISPSVVGSIGGGVLGSGLGPMGTVGGAMLGGMAGELLAQESGVAPNSELNMALAGGGPLLGPALGGGLRLGRRAIGATVERLPYVKVARARNILGRTVDEFESVGTRILAKQKGLLARTRGDLYKAAERAGVKVSDKAFASTKATILKLAKELEPISAFPEVRQSQKVLRQVAYTLLTNPNGLSIETILKVRSFVGAAVSQAEKKGGQPLGTAKQIFASLSDDLDRVASSPFKKGRQARLAQAAVKRAKLEFAVKDLEGAVSKFTTETADGVSINFKRLSEWLRQVTDHRHPRYDKNFSSALKDEIPELKERLIKLAAIAEAGSPGGPGSLVLRSKGAKAGAAVFGGLLGLVGAGPIGATVGAISGASMPEMLVAILTTKPGAAFLEKAVSLGKGSIHMREWIVAGEIALRALGEGKEGIEKAAAEEPTPPAVSNKVRKRLPPELVKDIE